MLTQYIYNTLTRSKELFQPIEPGRVRMYVCGMTVYDYCHLGHARVMVTFDVVSRWLRWLGYDVTYVRNITDIDDKIIQRAAECHEPIGTLTERFITAMHEDERALGCLPPEQEPRATQAVPAMLAMIQRLVERGYAYCGANHDVYYAVGKFAGYGKLSGKNPEQLRAGERVEIDTAKRDPLDFVLWKAAKPGEPAWESPWGAGRPGWHIECSAMSTAALGNHFDLHGGGMDLQFPHHENEIAQSEGATGEQFANYWLHNGFVRVNEEKMSKSLGNFFTVREVLSRYRAETVRFFILQSHYRSPLNYADESLAEADVALTRLYTALRELDLTAVANDQNSEGEACYASYFDEAMRDDFNTPVAISVLFDLAREVNRLRTADPALALVRAAQLRRLGNVIGLLIQAPEQFFKAQAGPAGLSDAEIDALVQQRTAAKQHKDFAAADRIRNELKALGVVLEDSSRGTTWRRGGAVTGKAE